MPRDLRPVNPSPLSESEEFQLRRLLDRRSQSLPEAQAQRDRYRELERKLQAKLDRKAALEARYSKRVAELRIDIDVISAEIHKIAPSGVTWRFVNEGLQKLGALAQTQTYFNTPFDTLDRDALMSIAELALEMYEASTKTKSSGKLLRERMADVKIDVGQDAPGEGGAVPDNRSALAAAIIAAGKKRRNEV